MTPDFRNQVNTARRAGYSDADIIGFLNQQDARIGQAMESGYDPSEILNFLAPQPTMGETATRMAGVVGRGAAPAALGTTAGATIGAVGGPVGAGIGAVVGGLSVPAADALVGAYNELFPDSKVTMPSESIRAALEKFGVGGVKPETRGERMAAGAAESLTGAVGGVAGGLAARQAAAPSVAAIGTEVSRAPLTQIITSAPIAAGTQFVGEATGSPLLALAAGTGAGAASGIRPRIRREGGPTRADIQAQVADKYKVLNTSGIRIDDTGFRDTVKTNLLKDLRAEGYSPTNPKLQGITNLIDDLTNNTQPKDIVELQNIREQITASASPDEGKAYRMMKIIRDRFDQYVENVPNSQIIAGTVTTDKDALNAWSQARSLFQKDRKAEVFQEILNNAPVSKGQFSQSGMENYLYNELKKIARNKDVMRTFTTSEQTAIREAAAGSGLQNALKFFGRFAPTGVIPGAATGGLFALDPTLGAAVGAGTFGARLGAEQMRIGSVQRIIDQILSGQQQPSPMVNVPATTMRGLLSTQME
jgi:hypothetical protein